ncbi:unnamed protein product [Gordionus sp. m RMFG-2023]
MHKLLVENQIQLVCTIVEIRLFIVTVNMMVDKISKVISFHNINGIWTVSIIIKNGLSITGNLLVDCETLTPYPLVRNMDNTGILYIPLGRDICEDPIYIMCIKLNDDTPCRCSRVGYKPPILSIICAGNNFTIMITHFYELRNKILQVFINKRLLECAITTIQLTFEDKTVDKSVAFVNCETKKPFIFRAGPSREIIVALPLKAPICLINESTLSDLCNKHAKDYPCRCITSMVKDHVNLDIQCLGTNTQRIVNSYNTLQKEFRGVDGWAIKFDTTVSTLTFPEMTKIIEPLGFCQNSSSFQEIVKDDKLAMIVPVGISACSRTMKSICELYSVKTPCKCDITNIGKSRKAIHFECEGSNITSIMDTYNYAQTELEKVQISTDFNDINMTKWTIINTTNVDVEIGDCTSLNKINPVKKSKNEQEFIMPIGMQTCATNTKGFCTVVNDRSPCRCSMITEGEKILPNFLCQGLKLDDLLLDSNTLRRDLSKLNIKSHDVSKTTQVTFEDFTTLPDIYDCISKVIQYREMEGNNVYLSINSSACTKEMLDTGIYYNPEIKPPLSRVTYFKSGLLRNKAKLAQKRSVIYEGNAVKLNDKEEEDIIQLDDNKNDKYVLSKKIIYIGAASLVGFMVMIIGSAVTAVFLFRNQLREKHQQNSYISNSFPSSQATFQNIKYPINGIGIPNFTKHITPNSKNNYMR